MTTRHEAEHSRVCEAVHTPVLPRVAWLASWDAYEGGKIGSRSSRARVRPAEKTLPFRSYS
jgi:hypothetical protein